MKIRAEESAVEITISLHTGNAAFENKPATEIARIVERVAGLILNGFEVGTLADINGNTVGAWSMVVEEGNE